MDRIGIFTPSSAGGHPLYTQELLTAMTEHPLGGRRFELITSEDLSQQFRGGPYPINDVLPKLSHRRDFQNSAAWFINRVTHYPRRERALLRWLKSRPDIKAVHFQEFAVWTAAHLVRQIRRMGKTVFYTVHNFTPNRYPPMVPPGLFRYWHRRACLSCDVLLVHSPAMADEVRRYLGDRHPPIHVVPHGVWTSHTTVATPPLDERLAWKKLLFFGVIRRNKGLDLLLSAAESLKGFSITIAGDPAERDYFDGQVLPQIRRLQASGMTIDLIPRFVSDEEAATLFATHSAAVLPYQPDFKGASGVAFMAIAHELPVVAGNFGAVGELFKEFQIGQTFGEFSPQCLAAAIQKLFDDPDHTSLIKQIRAAKESLSWGSAAALTIDLYSKTRQAQAIQDDAAGSLVT